MISFRAENSNTSRHLTEYTSLDLEMEFENDYTEVTYFIRDLLLYILQGLGERYSRQTERVRKEYKSEAFLVPKSKEDVPVITFAEGMKLLKEAGTETAEMEDIKCVMQVIRNIHANNHQLNGGETAWKHH
jgi:aspartyl-tRNA synthetase